MNSVVNEKRVVWRGKSLAAGSRDMQPTVYAFAISNNFSIHAVVAIKTLIRHEPRCRIFVFGLENCPGFERYIKRLGRDFKGEVTFILINKEIFLCLPFFAHLGYEAYLRLIMPEVLGAETQLFIYLDSDLVIEDSISKISSACSTEHPFAARPGPATLGTLQNKERVGFTNEMPYFNSGVMVINVDRWLRNNLTEKVFDILNREGARLVCADQDALNMAVQGEFSHLPMRYNVTSEFYGSDTAITRSSEAIDAIKRPAIIHFTGRYKPWIPLRRRPGTLAYLKARVVIQPRFIVTFIQQTVLWVFDRASKKVISRS